MVDRGRACPLSYRYRPEDLAGPADLTAHTLIVAGCAYAYVAALDAVAERARADDAVAVFNGDFHWLDTDPDDFRRVGEIVGVHHAILGNVEAELISDDDHGCGCAYPDYGPKAAPRTSPTTGCAPQVPRTRSNGDFGH